jgi:hypothetical protein
LLACLRCPPEAERILAAYRLCIYIAIQSKLADRFEFDRDDGNTKHLAAHKVTPAEFEQVMCNDALDLD